MLDGKRIWHNCIAKDRQEHMWAWPPGAELPFFFLWSGWGVSARWLRQMSRRLLLSKEKRRFTELRQHIRVN